jgi:hypothetical protein
MEFKSQIATTREQSDKLLALGLKPETADMYLKYDGNSFFITYTLTAKDKLVPYTLKEEDIPTWSLSRLLELLPVKVPDPKPGFEPHHPELIIHEKGYNISIRRYAADCLVGTHIEDSPIDCCVSIIEWLIKNKLFNKEHLK